MLLAGDIGGTKTHLALYEGDRIDSLKFIKEEKFPSKEHENLESIIEKFLEGNEKPSKACFGVAGPVKENKSRITNLPWIIDGKAIEEKLSIKTVKLLNDLETNAFGINMLGPDDFHILNMPKQRLVGNKVLISAGTGLGEAGIYFDGKEDHPFASEGGHADFAPQGKEQLDLLNYLRDKFGHVSYERVLSGQGIENIYAFLKEGQKVKPDLEVEKASEKAKAITKQAASGSEICRRALELFVAIYGAEAGNFALKLLAYGGVYIGGGIAPKNLDFFKRALFMEQFLSKGRFKELLSQIPVQIILNEKTALLGALYYTVKKISVHL